MNTVALAKGQNTALPEDIGTIDAFIVWEDPDQAVDASALLLDARGKVRSDADFVFYNQSSSPDGTVVHCGRGATSEGAYERVTLDLGALREDCAAVVIAGSVSEGTFGDLGRMLLRLSDGAGTVLAEFVAAGASVESALVFGEVYRRGGHWKVRAVGQGWSSGLAGLATDYGVAIDGDDGEEEEAAAPEAAGAGGPAGADNAPGETASRPVDADPGAPSHPEPRRPRRVSTSKRPPRRAQPPSFSLADGENWQPARLFSVAGVGSGDEQERRATSALVATMQAVRPLARSLVGRLGAPVGAFEGYCEVPFTKGETKSIPDAVWRVARGQRIWTALVEVKTGAGKLRKEQVESYLDIARTRRYDLVVTLSNDVLAGAGDLPVEVDRRKLAKVAYKHLSWADVIHEVRMLLAHGTIEDPLQLWTLGELLRYLEHPRSGAVELVDMGRHWVPVRDMVAAGTLRAGDHRAVAVGGKWLALSRHLAQRLTARLGAEVKLVAARRAGLDAAAQSEELAGRLAAEGVLNARFRIPDAAGDLTVEVDMRTGKVHCGTQVAAPGEGTSHRRVGWLVRQLKDAPADVQVEARFEGQGNPTCEHLATVREDPKTLYAGQAAAISAFALRSSYAVGSRRSGTAASFISSVTAATDTFYEQVLQPLREWVPAAPRPTAPPGEATGSQADGTGFGEG